MVRESGLGHCSITIVSFQTLPFRTHMSPIMEYSLLSGAEANRNTSLKAVFTYLRMVHFPQNSLCTDRFPPLSKSLKESHSLSFRVDMQGQMLSCASHLFPLSGLPTGSYWRSSCHGSCHGSEQAAAWYRAKEEPGLESQDQSLSLASSPYLQGLNSAWS